MKIKSLTSTAVNFKCMIFYEIPICQWKCYSGKFFVYIIIIRIVYTAPVNNNNISYKEFVFHISLRNLICSL